MRNLLAIALVLAPLAACAPPPLRGEAAELALAECVVNDGESMVDFQHLAGTGVQREGMAQRTASTIRTCRNVGRIDQRAMTVQRRSCVMAYATKADFYEAAEQLFVDPNPNRAAAKRLEDAMDTMRRHVSICLTPQPAGMIA